jgi:hypothetical protein
MVVAATSPMVANPTMGCVDDRGRLFVGDSAGVNWSPKKFEAVLPNRVLMLEDRDGDGVFERSTVFADKLAVPKGGCWADGSLFVDPPTARSFVLQRARCIATLAGARPSRLAALAFRVLLDE